MKDFYKTLGLDRDSSIETVRKRFRELAFEYHPDVSDNKNAAEIFTDIYEAYSVLGNPDEKSVYDLLYDNHFLKGKTHLPDEGLIKTEIQKASEAARDNAKQKAKISYRDFIKEFDCFFMPGRKADGIPYSFNMHKMIGISGGTGPAGSIKAKTVTIPIPRSRKAFKYHQAGLLIKISFFIMAILSFRISPLQSMGLIPMILLSTGIIFTGGFVTQLFYHFKNTKSKFFSASGYPLVKKYRRNGYKRGFHPMVSTTPVGIIVFLLRLIF